MSSAREHVRNSWVKVGEQNNPPRIAIELHLGQLGRLAVPVLKWIEARKPANWGQKVDLVLTSSNSGGATRHGKKSTMTKSGPLTEVFRAIEEGDPSAAADLLPLVYSELRKLARSLMARRPPGNTLQTTALVHEAYLRLVGDEDPGWNNCGHFFGAAAQAMRQILVDQARRKASEKHGGRHRRTEAREWDLAAEPPPIDILALDEALQHLQRADPRKARIVMLRYFAGLTEAETAQVLDISLRTVEREWRFARAVLFTQLSDRTDSGQA